VTTWEKIKLEFVEQGKSPLEVKIYFCKICYRLFRFLFLFISTSPCLSLSLSLSRFLEYRLLYRLNDLSFTLQHRPSYIVFRLPWERKMISLDLIDFADSSCQRFTFTKYVLVRGEKSIQRTTFHVEISDAVFFLTRTSCANCEVHSKSRQTRTYLKPTTGHHRCKLTVKQSSL